jgi:hypothetical protein
MTRIFDPPHPGETLREDVLPELGLTVTEAAEQLGVTRSAVARAECPCGNLARNGIASRAMAGHRKW